MRYKFKPGDVVKIIDESAFYYGAIGEVYSVDPYNEFSYFVVFSMVDEETGEETIYESCNYTVNQIVLYN
jgi:hypothetical protein